LPQDWLESLSIKFLRGMKRKEKTIEVRYEYIESEESQKRMDEIYNWVFNKISEYEKIEITEK
jgi:hypothetical protein